VVFNVKVDSGCSSHTFDCLNYIHNYKVMIEEDHSSMVLADRSRVQTRGKGSCEVLGNDYYVPEIRNCLLSVRQMDRQGVSTSFSDGLCEMRDRASGKVVLHCRIQDTNGFYTLSQEQFKEQLGIGHQLCMAHSIRTDPASRLHYILNPGVHGSRSSGYGGNHLGSPELLFIGKGPLGSHRDVCVGGTDQLSLSPPSEREEPNQPLSITSYTLRRFIYSMLATTESGV